MFLTLFFLVTLFVMYYDPVHTKYLLYDECTENVISWLLLEEHWNILSLSIYIVSIDGFMDSSNHKLPIDISWCGIIIY